MAIPQKKSRISTFDVALHWDTNILYFQRSTMKYKNVKELKEKIEAEVKEDFDFEQHLFKKYPSLFYTGIDGELLPQFQRCWNDCPKGWETIVDDLCGAIVNYTKNTSHSIPNPDKKIMRFLSKKWFVISRTINHFFNPYKNHSIVFNSEQKQKLENSFAGKVRKSTSTISQFFYKQELYIYQKPPEVKIVQYKEKFGTLRFYIDGGDENVEGMIRFAEYLTSKTCQNTGDSGSLVCKRSWYATLSPEEAKRLGFSINKDS